MKLKSRGAAAGLFLAILLCSPTFTKGQGIIDQAATPTGDQFMLLVGGGVGQEFRPTLTSLDFVELKIGSMFMDDAGTLLVRIREGTLDGRVLGLSEPVTLDYHGEPLIAHFSFAQSVALIPGETYVLEVPESGPPYQGWGASIGPAPYDRGRVVYSYGASLPDQDFWFREGILIVPEPQVNTLCLLALAILARKTSDSNACEDHG